MGTKRSNGQGSVYREGSSGRWVAAVSWVTPTGQRQTRRRTAATEREARGRLQTLVRERDSGLLVDGSRLTAGQWCQRWADEHLPRKVASGWIVATTAQTYRTHALRFVPLLQARDLAKVTRADVRYVLDEIGASYSPGTVRVAHSVLHRMLGDAVEAGLLAVNPASQVRSVRKPRGRQAPEGLDIDAAARLLDGLGDDVYGTALWLLLSLGLRRGEAMGLEWPRVSLADPPHVEVRANLVRAVDPRATVDAASGSRPSHWRLHDTKGHERGQAVLPLPAATAERLAAWRDVQRGQLQAAGRRWRTVVAYDIATRTDRPLDLVLTTPRGGPISTSRLGAALDVACARASLGRTTPHGLRHACASLLVAQGADVRTVQAILRHSSLEMTAGYLHQVTGLDRVALEGLVGPGSAAEEPVE